MKISQPPRYAFIITGASGNVGRHLIPILVRRGNRILAVGRDVTNLRQLYADVPEVDVADYDNFCHNVECDTLVHLAVHNNNQSGTLGDFIHVNVDFALRICRKFDQMGGRRFINISSIQCLDEENASHYALSKRIAKQRIEEFFGDRFDNIYIGYFHDRNYFGEKFRFLNRIGFLGTALFGVLKMLKPATSAGSLADYLSGPARALPVPGVLTDDLSKSSVYLTVVRALDIVVGACMLIVLLPILAILWGLVRLDSPGPAIFAQTRVGRGQALFTLYKFRTMKRDTAAAGTHEVSISAVTTVGKFLRGTKLDELPQAINLLRGEMTLVGPRPCLPTQDELVNARAALDVYAIKPGITGYAQIRGIDMSCPQDLANSDYIYMRLQSLGLNLKIVVLTALGRGGGDRVALLEKR